VRGTYEISANKGVANTCDGDVSHPSKLAINQFSSGDKSDRWAEIEYVFETAAKVRWSTRRLTLLACLHLCVLGLMTTTRIVQRYTYALSCFYPPHEMSVTRPMRYACPPPASCDAKRRDQASAFFSFPAGTLKPLVLDNTKSHNSHSQQYLNDTQ